MTGNFCAATGAMGTASDYQKRLEALGKAGKTETKRGEGMSSSITTYTTPYANEKGEKVGSVFTTLNIALFNPFRTTIELGNETCSDTNGDGKFEICSRKNPDGTTDVKSSFGDCQYHPVKNNKK